MIIPFDKTFFVKSAAMPSQLPNDTGCEIAFAGRSNAGKSTALNAITGIKNLAKTSKTPGRTQMINVFQISANWRLIDLPGYGFAKVPAPIKAQWEITLSAYLQTRVSLRGLCLLMDIRHPLQTGDQHMIAWAAAGQLPLHILLSKSDKLSRGNALNVLHKVKKALANIPHCSCQIFSVFKGDEILQARKQLSQWLT